MGRPLFSTLLSQQAPLPEPVIRVAEPQATTPTYERWSSLNNFDPDSEDFFAPENVVYEAFLTEAEVEAMRAREREEMQRVRQERLQDEETQEQQLETEQPSAAAQRLAHFRRTSSSRVPTLTTPSADQNQNTTTPVRPRLITTSALDIPMPELLSASSDSEDSTSEASRSGRASPAQLLSAVSPVSATGRLRRQISAPSSENEDDDDDNDDVDAEEVRDMPPLVFPVPASLLTPSADQIVGHVDWRDATRRMSMRRAVAGQ
jgi:hypothetical protein